MQIGPGPMQIWGTVPICIYFWGPNDEARITLQDCVPRLSRPNDEMGWEKVTPNDEPPREGGGGSDVQGRTPA
jgi:hypothetical protein